MELWPQLAPCPPSMKCPCKRCPSQWRQGPRQLQYQYCWIPPPLPPHTRRQLLGPGPALPSWQLTVPRLAVLMGMPTAALVWLRRMPQAQPPPGPGGGLAYSGPSRKSEWQEW